MQRAFPGSQITAPKDREYNYGLLDPDDGHVAHAALIGKSDAIVTDDRRAGFRTATTLIEATIDIVSPQDFAANTVAAHPDASLRAIVAMSSRMTEPPRSPHDVVDALVQRYDMIEVAKILAPRLTETP